MFVKIPDDLSLLSFQRNLIFCDIAELAPYGVYPVFRSFKYPVINLSKLHKVNITQQIIIIKRSPVLFHFLWKCRFLENALAGVNIPVLKLVGHVFIHLILKQFFHQLRSWIFLFAFLIDFLWQKHAALYVYECRRHDDKLTHNIHIALLHGMKIFQILVCYVHYRDIVNIHLILFYQMQEKVKRPLKNFKLDR